MGGTLAVDESSWKQEWETERRAKIERRQEKYKVSQVTPCKIDG